MILLKGVSPPPFFSFFFWKGKVNKKKRTEEKRNNIKGSSHTEGYICYSVETSFENLGYSGGKILRKKNRYAVEADSEFTYLKQTFALKVLGNR